MADSLVADVPTIGERTFIRSRPGDRLRRLYGQELRLIRAEDLEAGWAKSPDYRPADLSRSRLRKIEQFARFLAENQVIEAGNIRVTVGGQIAFRDGRHRTRVLLNLGMEAIPVTMPTDSLDRFKRCYTD